MKLEKHLKIKIILNNIINQKLSKFQSQKIKKYTFKDSKHDLYQILDNLIVKLNSIHIPIYKQELKHKFFKNKIKKYKLKLLKEKNIFRNQKNESDKKKELYIKNKNKENLELEHHILILESDYLNLDTEMELEIEEITNVNLNLKEDNNSNIQYLNYKLKMKKYSKLEIENIRHSLEILKEENKYIDEEEEMLIIDIKKRYDKLKKKYEIKKEIKIYDLEENKKLELEQFEVYNSRIDEIEDYLIFLNSKNFNIKEEFETNKMIIEKKVLIQSKINQQLEILKTKIKKEEKLKKYTNRKYLNYDRNILKMNADMSWKEKKIDLVDIIKSILDKNSKIKREIRMYKI